MIIMNKTKALLHKCQQFHFYKSEKHNLSTQKQMSIVKH
jgi:hypothetical protein